MTDSRRSSDPEQRQGSDEKPLIPDENELEQWMQDWPDYIAAESPWADRARALIVLVRHLKSGLETIQGTPYTTPAGVLLARDYLGTRRTPFLRGGNEQ